MRQRRELLILAAVLALAAVAAPGRLGAPDLDHAAAALAVAGPAAAAALGLALGRPSLAPGLISGLGAYVTAGLALRGLWVPVSLGVAALAGAALGGLIALLTAPLDVVGLLAATLLIAAGLAAATQALPDLSGGQSGLGPVPPLGTPVAHGDLLQLTASGDLHALLVTTLLVALAGSALLAGRRGAAWRAIGSDRDRAAATGLHPLRSDIVAFSAAGALAGLGGATAAHIAGTATPDVFSPDVIALPLLAALLAGQGRMVATIAIAIGTALVGTLVLPDLGWRGPPAAPALALGLLAVATVASLLPVPSPPRRRQITSIAATDPWPIAAGALAGATLVVEHLDVRAGPVRLIDDVHLRAEPGQIHGVVGPNGAGKSSLLATIARRPPGVKLLGGSGPVVLQPQTGGGFAACTVRETLELASSAGGRSDGEAAEAATAWLARLRLEAQASTLCSDLATGQRRLLDLARVLLRRPAVLLCDEPLAGLDPGARAAVESLLAAAAGAGLTIVVAEHDRGAVARLAALTTELRRPDLSPAQAT
ncbi:MAG: ABC transporter permease subunit [Candidatus Dormibacteria bacterium]